MQEIFNKKKTALLVLIHLLAACAFLKATETFILSWLILHLLFATLGVSVGLHRYFSHRQFKATKAFENLLGTVSTLCMQGGPIFWSAAHRAHHIHTEKSGDPHDASRGFWWAHLGWLCFDNPNQFSYTSSAKKMLDLRKNRYLIFLEKRSTSLNLIFLSVLFFICFLFGEPILFFWIGPLRIVSVWHLTWLTNSYSHNAELQSAQSRQIPYKNSLFLTFFMGGEGNHQLHHSEPNRLNNSDGVFQIDIGYFAIKVFQRLNLIKITT